jgi:hypothetical protein
VWFRVVVIVVEFFVRSEGNLHPDHRWDRYLFVVHHGVDDDDGDN